MAKLILDAFDAEALDIATSLEYDQPMGTTFDEYMQSVRYMASIVIWVLRNYGKQAPTEVHCQAILAAIVGSYNFEGVTAISNGRSRPPLRVTAKATTFVLPRDGLLDVIGVLSAQEKLKIKEKETLANAKNVYSFLRCFRSLAAQMKTRNQKPVFFEKQLGRTTGDLTKVVYGGEYFDDLSQAEEAVLRDHFKQIKDKVKNAAGTQALDRFESIRVAVKRGGIPATNINVARVFKALLKMGVDNIGHLNDQNLLENFESIKQLWA